MLVNTINRPDIAVHASEIESPWPGFEELEEFANVIQSGSPETLKSVISDAQILVVTDFNAEIFENIGDRAPKLEWIHATSTGVNRLIRPELLDSSIVLTRSPEVFDHAIAETVLGFIIAFAKDLPETLRLQAEHRWQHRDTERFSAKRVLVVGAGSIGTAIGQLLKAAGMEVEGIARTPREDDPVFGDVRTVDVLLSRLPLADYVVIATPLTMATKGLFGAKEFAAMKPGARLINIARGEIINTVELVSALEEAQIAGAALDAFEIEPLPKDHPLWDMENLIISPHMSGDFYGWRQALSAHFIENFHRWRTGKPLANVVDKERGY